MVFVGRVRRPVLSAQERRPGHPAEIQSFLRGYRPYSTGVNPVMVPLGMMPKVIESYAGFNIWHDPSQGYYWVDGFEPAFQSVEGARTYAAANIPLLIEPGASLVPIVIGLGVLAALVG